MHKLRLDVTIEPRSHRRLRANIVPASAVLRLVRAVFISTNHGGAAVLTGAGCGSDLQTLHCPGRVKVYNITSVSHSNNYVHQQLHHWDH